MASRPSLALLVALCAGAALIPYDAVAQERTDTTRQADTVEVRPRPTGAQEGVALPQLDRPASPGGAFLRALLVPGWGHASIGSYSRAGFYFAAESATAWMLLRVSRRKNAADDVRDLRQATVEARVRRQGITDPFEVQDSVDADPDVEAARGLVSARGQQFEDWTAFGIFMLFLSGADAFVSAHLADFPEPVEAAIRPLGPDRFEVGISVPLGGGGRGRR